MAQTRNPSIDDGTSSGSKSFILIVLVVIVLGIGLVAFVATRRDSSLTNQTSDSVAIDGESLPNFTTGGVGDDTDPAVGMTAPSLTGETFDGDELSITNDGSPKAIYFITHHCIYCQAEVPKIQSLVNAGQVPDGFELYAVSTAVDAAKSNYPPEAWLNSEDWTVPTIKDDDASDALAAYGGTGFPYVVILDADNKVVVRASGEQPDEVTLGLWDLGLLGSEPASDE